MDRAALLRHTRDFFIRDYQLRGLQNTHIPNKCDIRDILSEGANDVNTEEYELKIAIPRGASAWPLYYCYSLFNGCFSTFNVVRNVPFPDCG